MNNNKHYMAVSVVKALRALYSYSLKIAPLRITCVKNLILLANLSIKYPSLLRNNPELTSALFADNFPLNALLPAFEEQLIAMAYKE